MNGDDSPNPNHDFQGSGGQWGRDEIYPTWFWWVGLMLSMLNKNSSDLESFLHLEIYSFRDLDMFVRLELAAMMIIWVWVKSW